jgi:hypothetical protein
MSVVLRGAKKLRVKAAFVGSLTAADVGTGLVDYLAVRGIVSDLPLAPLYFPEIAILDH